MSAFWGYLLRFNSTDFQGAVENPTSLCLIDPISQLKARCFDELVCPAKESVASCLHQTLIITDTVEYPRQSPAAFR